jgi:hypothetical protein
MRGLERKACLVVGQEGRLQVRGPLRRSALAIPTQHLCSRQPPYTASTVTYWRLQGMLADPTPRILTPC